RTGGVRADPRLAGGTGAGGETATGSTNRHHPVGEGLGALPRPPGARTVRSRPDTATGRATGAHRPERLGEEHPAGTTARFHRTERRQGAHRRRRSPRTGSARLAPGACLGAPTA